MYLLFPGRHHLLTQFQFDYLKQVLEGINGDIKDVDGIPIPFDARPTSVIFAVTSSNHSNTRRNPLPFYLRSMMLAGFSAALKTEGFVYGIDDLGSVPDFAKYTIKRIRHENDGRFDLTPGNTLVLCSTPVLEMYRELGFRILPAELIDTKSYQHHTEMPWDLVERIAANPDWATEEFLQRKIHSSSFTIWHQYRLGERVQLIFNDKMIGSDGDLTSTRDYNVYVRQMDEIAEMKFTDTAEFIQPGRIGDIGCAVGSWIKQASRKERLRESDFYGIEVSRFLFELCQQRKLNKEYSNPFVFFSQKNAVTGLVFPPNSMNTIHTSSLTHEIESYGGREDLLHFIRNRHEELVHSGVWINRDVVAPSRKEEQILLWLNKEDGAENDPFMSFTKSEDQAGYLRSLSTYCRFMRFARDFRSSEGYNLIFQEVRQAGQEFISLSMRDAAEFLSRKDYADNWDSEMHETFCFWDFDEWCTHLKEAGFSIHHSSRVFRNEWIVDHRWKGHAKIFRMEDDKLIQVPYPVTTMILVGVKN